MAILKSLTIAVGTSAANSGSPDIALVFSAQPAANDTIRFGDTTFTFVASGATGTQINIGANLAAALANVVTVVNAHATEGAKITIASNGSTTLTVTSDTTGPVMNAYRVLWNFATATINPDAAGASITGDTTLAGGGVAVTGGFGFKAITIEGDGAVRFTTAGGQLVAIRDINLNKLLHELMLDQDSGLGDDREFFGVGGTT